jgi:hypothetical protein
MSDFRDDWGYPNEVLPTIPGARYYDVNPLPEPYRTGRPKFEAVFYNADRTKVLARQDAMELVSKRTGRPYTVCRRYGSSLVGATAPAPAPEHPRGYSLDDVLV